jgi:O-antigen ligase
VLTVKRISRWLIAFGAALALIGIVQRGLTAGELQPLIYGFWRPQFESETFGPFVNPNHFAGWMLMTLPVALAAFLDLVLRMVESAPDEGSRFSALTSPQIGAALFLGIACLVMGLSLLMTRSRSALAAFALGSVMAGWVVFRRQARGKARLAVAGSALVLFFGTVAWAGLDTIVTKFTEPQGRKSFAARMGAWRDTVSIIRDFPLAGSGLDTYGTAMNLYQTGSRERHFQEAHNDYLQLAAEGGLLVGIPVLVTIGFFIRDVRRRFREAPKHGTTYCLRVGAVVGLISIALQSLVEFSLQMPGNAALFALLAGVAIHQSPNLTGFSSRTGGRARIDPPYLRTSADR